jgi:hypothetical protein
MKTLIIPFFCQKTKDANWKIKKKKSLNVLVDYCGQKLAIFFFCLFNFSLYFLSRFKNNQIFHTAFDYYDEFQAK